MDKVKKLIEDWGKFLAVLMAYVIGTTKYPAEVETALANAGIEIRLFGRAVSRAINHNLVVWMRPFFTGAIWVQGIVFVLGFIPLVALAYNWEALIYGLVGAASFFALMRRHQRSANVRAIYSAEAFYARDGEVLNEYGPSDRFSATNFFFFPLMMMVQGFVLFAIAIMLRSIYGTSVRICWPMALVGFISIILGLVLFSYSLSAAKRLVASVGNWGETVASTVAKKVFDWSLLGIDESNAAKLIPPSAVKVADELFTELEKTGKVFVDFILPMLALAGAMVSVGIPVIIVVASVFLGAFVYSLSKSSEKKENEKAKSSIAVSRAFLYALASFFLVVNIVLTDAFGWHATPATDGAVQTGFWLMRMLTRNPFTMVVVTTALTWGAYKLYNMKVGESLLVLNKVGALILFAFLGIMTFVGIGYWTGENITPADTYFNRFKHTDDEALYCLNGKRDFDEIDDASTFEIEVDYGPSCSPYRRGTNQPGYESSASQPFEIESDANGGPLRYFTCSKLGWFCFSSRARAQPPVSQAPTATPVPSSSGSSNLTNAVAMNDENKGIRGYRVTASGELSPYESLIAQATARHSSIPPHFLRSVMWIESRFYANVRTSSTGANGLMQFMPGTARSYGITDVRDPQQAVPAGAHYLSDLYAQTSGSHEDRLCLTATGYVSGSGGMQAILRRPEQMASLLEACRLGDLDRYPNDERFTKFRYAVKVMRVYYGYLNGTRPDDPSRRYDRSSPSRPSVEESEPQATRELLATAGLTVSAEDCSGFTEAYRQMVQPYGFCND